MYDSVSYNHLAPPPAYAARALILANPKAGQLRDARASAHPLESLLSPAIERIAEAVREQHLNACVEAIPPLPALFVRIRAAQQEGYDTIVAAGGDGTVRTVAEALVNSPLRLGVLPMGTDNNFAHALGIPFTLQAALETLAQGQEQRVDVGRIGNEVFLEAAGVGLFADALLAFGPEEPRKTQIVRLLRVLGPLCWNLRARRLALIVDGVMQQEEAIMVTAANASYLGAGMPMAPDAGLSDGLFDVVIVGAMSRTELLRFALALMRGTHLELPKVRRVRAATIEIRRRRRITHPLPVHADDHITGYTPARLEIVPGALRVLVPN